MDIKPKLLLKFTRLSIACLAAASAPHDLLADDTLKVYLLLGQSNMLGEGYAWDTYATDPGGWNVPTLEYLSSNQAYYNSLPDEVFTFKQAIDSTNNWAGFANDWLENPRSDVWAVGYNSSNGSNMQVRNTEDTTPGNNNDPVWPSGIQPLSVGFGHHQSIGSTQSGNSLRPPKFGPELGMGHSLGNALDSPVMFFKSSVGGTTLGVDWRPPSAVANRGGAVGVNYTNSMNRFIELLNQLDQDIVNGVLDDKYNGATDYEVAGVVWLQGWNESVGGGVQYIPEYDQNLFDFITDIRAADARIPDDLPIVIAESSDQNVTINAERQVGVDAINAVTPGSAVFIEMNGLKDVNYGGLNSAGAPFTSGYGYHFHARAENFIEIGYRIGQAIIDNGFTGSEVGDPADLDADGDVDDADFGIAFAAFTGPGGVSNSPADLDNDGDVDDADFGLAFAAFTGPGGVSSTVPEPMTLTLLGTAVLLLVSRRRRA